jgi:hypothetical protein
MSKKPRTVEAVETEEDEPEVYELLPEDEGDDYADVRRGGKHCVSVNGKLGRLIIYQDSYREMLQAIGKKEILFVRLRSHPRYPQRFWIIPVDSKDIKGARQVHKAAKGNTVAVSARTLINAFGFTNLPTAQFSAAWEPINKGLLVDLRKRI